MALGMFLCGLGAVLVTGEYWAIAPVVLGCALLYLLAHSYVELVRVIVDMLLPKLSLGNTQTCRCRGA